MISEPNNFKYPYLYTYIDAYQYEPAASSFRFMSSPFVYDQRACFNRKLKINMCFFLCFFFTYLCMFYISFGWLGFFSHFSTIDLHFCGLQQLLLLSGMFFLMWFSCETVNPIECSQERACKCRWKSYILSILFFFADVMWSNSLAKCQNEHCFIMIVGKRLSAVVILIKCNIKSPHQKGKNDIFHHHFIALTQISLSLVLTFFHVSYESP